MRGWRTGMAIALTALAGCQRSADAAGNLAAAEAGEPVAADAPSGPAVAVPVGDPVFGMPALSIRVPAGWLSEGSVVRDACDDLPAAVFRANAPGGATGVQLFPRFVLLWSDADQYKRMAGSKGCTVAPPPASPADWVRTSFIPRARPGATVVSVGPIPDDKTAEQTAAANRQLQAQVAQFNGQNGLDTPLPRMTGSAERVRIRYERDGRAFEEDIDASLLVRDQAQFNPMGGPRYAHLVTATVTVLGARAPAGRLDAAQPVFAAMGKSIAPNPAWQQRLAAQQQGDLQGNIAAIQADAARGRAMHDRYMGDLARNTADSIDHIHAIGRASMENAARMEAARHGSAQATVEHMGDRQTMADPATGDTVQLSNQYGHSYYDAQRGRVLQTNQAGDPGADWTELQVVGPR